MDVEKIFRGWVVSGLESKHPLWCDAVHGESAESGSSGQRLRWVLDPVDVPPSFIELEYVHVDFPPLSITEHEIPCRLVRPWPRCETSRVQPAAQSLLIRTTHGHVEVCM